MNLHTRSFALKSKIILPISLLIFGATETINAATITMTLNGAKTSCSYTSISTDANGNQTVTCSSGSTTGTPTSTAQVPQCSLQASASSIVKGASTNLMVSCSPVATSYTWTNTGVVTTVSAVVSVSPIVTTTYTVIGRNAAGAGNTAILTIPVSAPAAPAPVPTTQPTLTVAQWNYEFETINNLPHNLKWESVEYMAYLKQMQAAKPTQYKLPGSNASTPVVTPPVSTPPVTTPSTPTPAGLTATQKWNYQFETLNNIPHNYKLSPGPYKEYLELLYRNKPHMFKLP